MTTIERTKRTPNAWAWWPNPVWTIRAAVKNTATWKEAAEALGVTAKTLANWRRDFPEIFQTDFKEEESQP